MKPELMWLLWAVALTVVQMLIAVSGATLQVGLPRLAGNRDGLTDCTGWVGRAQRAHRNMLESLVLFAVLVLVSVLLNKTNSTTAMAAQLFVWARLAYALVYMAGIPWLRTLVWATSMAGLVIIFFQLV